MKRLMSAIAISMPAVTGPAFGPPTMANDPPVNGVVSVIITEMNESGVGLSPGSLNPKSPAENVIVVLMSTEALLLTACGMSEIGLTLMKIVFGL